MDTLAYNYGYISLYNNSPPAFGSGGAFVEGLDRAIPISEIKSNKRIQ